MRTEPPCARKRSAAGLFQSKSSTAWYALKKWSGQANIAVSHANSKSTSFALIAWQGYFCVRVASVFGFCHSIGAIDRRYLHYQMAREGLCITGYRRVKMGDVVNLRRARKSVARQRKADAAAGNRIFHGRSKAEHSLQKVQEARRDLSDRDLDRHRIGSGEANEVSGRQKIHRDRRTQD